MDRPPPAVDCDALRHPRRAASWQHQRVV